MSIVSKIVSYFEGPSKAASAVRHAAVTGATTFVLLVLPVVADVGAGHVNVAADKAVLVSAAAAAAAAALRVAVPALRAALLGK